MYTVRCSICLLRFQKLKFLYGHYLKYHSKIKIIQRLLEQNSKQVLLKSKRKILKNSKQTFSKTLLKKWSRNDRKSETKTYETETFILRENGIFCGEDDIIGVGDHEASVKVSFNNVTQDHCYLNWKKFDRKRGKSSASKIKPTSKRKIKKKKLPRRKKLDYHINITNLQDTISLDHQNGAFYTCHCRESDCPESGNFQNADLRLATSDTESCSETSKYSFIPLEDSKLFCQKCGSGYKTEAALSEHMYIHEPFCRLCNIWFPNVFAFKQHMQLHKIRVFACHICTAEFPLKETLFKHLDSHMEDKVLEDVLDMEEEYKIFRNSFLNNSYNASINSIMCYLKDRPDIYYCNYMKVVCDICYKEVFTHDYEWHLQMFHIY